MEAKTILTEVLRTGQTFALTTLRNFVLSAHTSSLKEIVDLAKFTIKDKRAYPTVKLRALRALATCIDFGNPDLVQYAAKKTLSRLSKLATFKKEFDSEARGAGLFGAYSDQREQQASADFLHCLLEYIRSWAQKYPVLGGAESAYKKTYTKLASKVAFPPNRQLETEYLKYQDLKIDATKVRELLDSEGPRKKIEPLITKLREGEAQLNAVLRIPSQHTRQLLIISDEVKETLQRYQERVNEQSREERKIEVKKAAPTPVLKPMAPISEPIPLSTPYSDENTCEPISKQMSGEIGTPLPDFTDIQQCQWSILSEKINEYSDFIANQEAVIQEKEGRLRALSEDVALSRVSNEELSVDFHTTTQELKLQICTLQRQELVSTEQKSVLESQLRDALQVADSRQQENTRLRCELAQQSSDFATTAHTNAQLQAGLELQIKTLTQQLAQRHVKVQTVSSQTDFDERRVNESIMGISRAEDGEFTSRWSLFPDCDTSVLENSGVCNLAEVENCQFLSLGRLYQDDEIQCGFKWVNRSLLSVFVNNASAWKFEAFSFEVSANSIIHIDQCSVRLQSTQTLQSLLQGKDVSYLLEVSCERLISKFPTVRVAYTTGAGNSILTLALPITILQAITPRTLSPEQARIRWEELRPFQSLKKFSGLKPQITSMKDLALAVCLQDTFQLFTMAEIQELGRTRILLVASAFGKDVHIGISLNAQASDGAVAIRSPSIKLREALLPIFLSLVSSTALTRM